MSSAAAPTRAARRARSSGFGVAAGVGALIGRRVYPTRARSATVLSCAPSRLPPLPARHGPCRGRSESKEDRNMVSIASLWLPILLSAVVVFILSAILHMVLPIHKNDFKKVPREEELVDAFRKLDVPPGDYLLPWCSMESMKDPAAIEKMTKGPIVIMTVERGKAPGMGKELVQWFLFCVVVSIFAAYITGHAVASGAPYLHVFRFAGCVAFMGYGLGAIPDSIWYKRNWGTTWKSVFDALLYGLFTAGMFGWLWPR